MEGVDPKGLEGEGSLPEDRLRDSQAVSMVVRDGDNAYFTVDVTEFIYVVRL